MSPKKALFSPDIRENLERPPHPNIPKEFDGETTVVSWLNHGLNHLFVDVHPRKSVSAKFRQVKAVFVTAKLEAAPARRRFGGDSGDPQSDEGRLRMRGGPILV